MLFCNPFLVDATDRGSIDPLARMELSAPFLISRIDLIRNHFPDFFDPVKSPEVVHHER